MCMHKPRKGPHHLTNDLLTSTIDLRIIMFSDNGINAMNEI